MKNSSVWTTRAVPLLSTLQWQLRNTKRERRNQLVSSPFRILKAMLNPKHHLVFYSASLRFVERKAFWHLETSDCPLSGNFIVSTTDVFKWSNMREESKRFSIRRQVKLSKRAAESSKSVRKRWKPSYNLGQYECNLQFIGSLIRNIDQEEDRLILLENTTLTDNLTPIYLAINPMLNQSECFACWILFCGFYKYEYR